jgi:hypothetical protein
MNLLWVACISGFVLLEKITSGNQLVSRLGGVGRNGCERRSGHGERNGRQFYAAAYARDDGLRAGFEHFKSFEQDAKDFAALSTTKLNKPRLLESLTGGEQCACCCCPEGTGQSGDRWQP